MLARWCRIMPQGDIPKRQAVHAGTARPLVGGRLWLCQPKRLKIRANCIPDIINAQSRLCHFKPLAARRRVGLQALLLSYFKPLKRIFCLMQQRSL